MNIGSGKIGTFVKGILSKGKSCILDRTRTASFWDRTDTSESREYWWNIEAVRSTIYEEITGDRSCPWYTKMIRERATPFGRILAFGDAAGAAGEAYLTRRDTTEIIYFNISRGEGIRFLQLMEELNIDIPCRFVCGDANSFDFTALGTFDTIMDTGAFHHMENFESIFPQLNRMLTPDGLLIVDEYVGPSRWKFDAHVIEIVNQWLHSLPASLITSSEHVCQDDFNRLCRLSGDPSESIRSGDLDRMLRDYFSLIEAVSFGGTLLQPLFLTSHLNPCRLNIDNWHNTDTGVLEAERLTRYEYRLIRSGEIHKDYQYYILAKQ